MKVEEKKDNKLQPCGDFGSVIILFIFYWLQGTIFGFFTFTLPIIWAEQGVPLKDLTPMTFTYYPYTFKILFAPFVDTYYWDWLGKRKSYVVPIQYIIAGLFFLQSFNIEQMIQSQAIISLTFIGMVYSVLLSFHDIAVDAWAIKLLSQENQSYAASCQTIGHTLGYMTSQSLFIILCSLKWPQSNIPVLTSTSYFFILSIGLAIFTFYVQAFIHEGPEVEREYSGEIEYPELDPNASRDIIPSQKEIKTPLPEKDKSFISGNGEPRGFFDTVKLFKGFYKNFNIRYVILFVIIFRWGFAPINSAYYLKLVQNGVKKELISQITMIAVPFYLIYPIFMTKFFRDTIKLKNMSYQLMFTFYLQLMQYWILQRSGEQFMYNTWMQILIGLVCIVDNCLQIFFTMVRITFTNSIAARGIEGAYVTVIASLDNVGNKVSNTLSLYLSGAWNFSQLVVIGWAYSIVLIFTTFFRLERLTNMKKEQFDVRKIYYSELAYKKLKERVSSL